MAPKTLNKLIDAVWLASGPICEDRSSNFLIGRKPLTPSMKIQEILISEFRKIFIRSQPVNSAFDLGKPPRCFRFCEGLSSALLLLATSLCNEEPAVTKSPNKVG